MPSSTQLDDEDYEKCKEHSWFYLRGYAATKLNYKNVYLHVFILGFKGIDHKDGNRLNNQRSNLRKATPTQNAANKRKQGFTSSKYKGVSFSKEKQKWCAYIDSNYIRYRLGYFLNEVDAAKAYNAKALELFGEFARLNEV